MPRLKMDVATLFNYVPGGRFYIEERLQILRLERDPVTKYNEPTRRFYLEQRLRNLKMREGQMFEEFLWFEFIPVYEELLDTGRELDEETLVFLFLNALPNSWSGFVGVVVLLGLDMLSVVDVLLKVTFEEEGEFRADSRNEINRRALDIYKQLWDVRASEKIKDIRDSECEKLSAKASNLSIRDTNAGVPPAPPLACKNMDRQW